ncbi:MAG TPA: CBS domain-containing protein, partial [Pseudonocardia sp.]|nr:CBS domain-containing protein [Pseudonocardia sp.]
MRLAELVDLNDIAAVRAWLDGQPVHVIADELARMTPTAAGVPFRLLPKGRALAVFEELDPPDQQELLAGLRDEAFAELVEEMDPDDRARMLGEAPAKVVKRVLAGLSAAERRMTAALLGYPDGSVGRLMSPETVAVPAGGTVATALEVVRRTGHQAETVYTLPVVDAGRCLVGAVTLR